MFKLSANMFNGLLAGILASLATSAAAQEMPKQFEFSVTYHAVVTSDMVTLAEKDFAGSFHGKFIATNDSGGVFMHNMFGNCSYAVVRAKGVLEMSGGCTYTDKDGDQLYETFKIPPVAAAKSHSLVAPGSSQALSARVSSRPWRAAKIVRWRLARRTDPANAHKVLLRLTASRRSSLLTRVPVSALRVRAVLPNGSRTHLP